MNVYHRDVEKQRWAVRCNLALIFHVEVLELANAALLGGGHMLEAFKEWFLSLGEKYGVNPIIFGLIYVGAIPFFTASVAWLIRNLRSGRPIVLPTLCASFCFVSAYLYLAIAGKNIPTWVYAVIVAMVGYGAYSTIRKVKSKVQEARKNASEDNVLSSFAESKQTDPPT